MAALAHVGDGLAHRLDADRSGQDLLADHESRGARQAELVAEPDILGQGRLHLRSLRILLEALQIEPELLGDGERPLAVDAALALQELGMEVEHLLGLELLLGGERDLAVDSAILNTEVRGGTAPGFLNDRLMNDLRPTLFLAQLSNLLAGNIAIVHGVTGSSRTFMGEEAAGYDSARIALARIASGQSDLALIGAAHNGERKDLLMLYEFGDFNLTGKHSSVWARGDDNGFALGSAGAFLVIESKAHAQARGAKPFARLSNVVADMARRNAPGQITAALEGLWDRLGAIKINGAIITGATGARPATAEETAFLKQHADATVRATGTAFGHGMETQFPLGLALAALSISRGALYPPNDATGFEIEKADAPTQIVVIGTGHWRGEGMALVESAT